MTYEERKVAIYDEIKDYLTDNYDVARDIHNQIGDGDEVHLMDDFDDVYDGEYPSTIAEEVTCGSYDGNDAYFIRSNGECQTSDDLSDFVDFDSITETILENEDNYGYDDIEEFLQRLNEDDHSGIKVGDSEYTYDEFKSVYEFSDTLLINADEMGLYENIDIRTGSEWVNSLDSDSEIKLEVVDFKRMLEGVSLTNSAPIVGYNGYIFGGNNEMYEGRFFRYFYVPEKSLLLRLVYGSMPTDSWGGEFCYPMYIIDTRSTINGIYSVISALND